MDNENTSKLSSADSIVQAVRRADNDISFIDTIGSFVQNNEFKAGYNDMLNGKDSSISYVWRALSAIGQDVNSIVYSNVLNYVDAVANIDTCSVKSLKSMMKLVGSSYQLFGNLDMLPVEVLQLLDVLSISRKYLLQNDKVKQALADDIESAGPVVDCSSQQSLKWKYQYMTNAFIVSADDLPECINGIYGRYSIEDDYAYSYAGGPSYLSGSSAFKPIPFSTAESMENFQQIASFNGEILSGLVCRSYKSSTAWKIVKYFQYADADPAQTDGFEWYAVVDRAGNAHYVVSAEELESSVSQDKNTSILSSTDGWMKCEYSNAKVDETFIDPAKYRQYVENLYASMLSSFVTMKYNTKQEGVLPIYCYVRDEYYKTNDYYEKIDNSEGSRRRFKTKNNIPLSFDEKRAADGIDNGTDSLDNYFGAERELVEMEIASRARSLSFSQIGLDSDQSDNIVEKYTRYSYYRKAKVLEYMHFIDNQYFSGNAYLSSSGIYEFNPNYYEVEKVADALSCHVVKNLDKYTGDIETEIDMSIVEAVADTLAELTMFISKLREKVRLQTRKNYMKGTNNLVRYVINEYLVDLARNSPLFKNDALSANCLSAVRSELSANDIDNVEVVEYYDTTQYYNVQTAKSDDAVNPGLVNGRYWENVIAQDLSGRHYAIDGIAIPQSQIDKFYLSTLNLKNSLSDADSNAYEFLKTVFSLGANTSYVSKDGMFVTKLSSGQYSDEVYSKYIELSAAYDQLAEYADGYTFNQSQTAAQQLDGLTEHLVSKVSADYFADVSANYDAYMPYAKLISDAVDKLSSEYSYVLSSYDMYLQKSDSPYSYDGSTYKHDYYIGNSIYDASMLIDKFGNLRAFANSNDNMHVWEFTDGLAALASQLSSISNSINTIKTSIYSNGIEFNDVDSQYADTELNCMLEAVNSAQRHRAQQLQTVVETGQELASGQYQSALQQLNAAAEEYKQMEKQYSDVLAQYRSPYVNQFGVSSLNYIAKAYSSELGDTVTVTYNAADVEPIDTKAKTLKEKCKAAVDWMSQPIKWKSDAEQEEAHTVVKFGSRYNIPDSPYLVANAGIEAALTQISSRIEQMETQLDQLSSGKDTAFLKPLNNAFKNTYAKLSSPNAWTGDIAFTSKESEYDKSSIPNAYSSLADQLKAQYMEKAAQLDDAESLFKNDKTYATCTVIARQIADQQTKFQSLSQEYSTFAASSTVSQYLQSYDVQRKLSMQECSRLSAFSVQADDNARRGILSFIDQMYSQYYTLQEQYVKLVDVLKVAMPQYNYANDYLDADISAAISSIEDDVKYNTDLAFIKVNSKANELEKSLVELAQCISSSLADTGSTVLQMFSDELQKYDVLRDPQYIAAKELFYQYTGLSGGQAPFFNYPNMTHSSKQLHGFMWNFIEADQYVQISQNSFDAVYVEELETQMAVSAVDAYVGEYGQLIDTWKHNVQDYTGYSTRYIDSTHQIPTFQGVFEAADYDGAFYPPAVEMLRAGPEACIKSLHQQYAVTDAANALRSSDKMQEQLSIYSAQEFFSLAWQLLDGNTYMKLVPNGNLRAVVDKFIEENSVPGYSYEGNAVMWMSSTKDEFASYVIENTTKSFYERFYYPLGLTKQNYEFIANQLSCSEVLDQISAITDSHQRKDLYDIYNYGLDTYGNMYILYKQYGEESPTYQTKKNTLGQMWIRMKNHAIAVPMLLSSTGDEDLSPIDMHAANEYLQQVKPEDIKCWCYDFCFSDNRKLVNFVCKNTQDGLDEYFKGKYKYSKQALAIVSQKTNLDLGRPVLSISNPDDVPDDIVTQPYLKKLELPQPSGADTYAYQFLGQYAPQSYAVGLVYVKTNYHLEDDGSIQPYLDCPPDVVVLNASNETMNIELQGMKHVSWNNKEFKLADGESPQFKFSNDQAVFSYNYAAKQLSFAFLGSLLADSSGREADCYKTSTCDSISISAASSGSTIDDPAQKEMNSFDVFTDCIAVAQAKPTAVGISMAGKLKLYNTNADASYLPLYAGNGALVDQLAYNGSPYCAFELLGMSKDLDQWISRANPYVDLGISLSSIYEDKVVGRIYDDILLPDGYMNGMKSSDVSSVLRSTAVEQYSPLMNEVNQASEDIQHLEEYHWTVDFKDIGLVYDNPEDVHVVMYNVALHGKNPYYVCTLRDFMEDWSPAEGKHACYNTDKAEVQHIDVSASVFNPNAACIAVSTQPYSALSSVDNNNIDGVSAIVGKYSSEDKALEFTFKLSAYAEDQQPPFVPKDQIRLLLFNPTFLSAFNNYHLFDIYGMVHILDYRCSPIDKIGDNWYITYDKSRFEIGPYYIDSNGSMHMLSDVDFNDYDALSDVYVLKDTSHLQFKYDEQSIYGIEDDMYYYPSVNIKYPYSPGSYLESLGFKDQLRTGSYFSNAFDSSNYYVFRLDDPATIANKIGRVSIAIEARDTETLLAFEDYINDGNISRYDDADTRNISCLQFVTEDGPAYADLNEEDESKLMSSHDIEEAIAEVSATSASALSAAGGDWTLKKEDRVPQLTFFADSSSVKLDDALKVYASYKKEEDKTITLYFNYTNYLDTPFVKIKDNAPVPAVIDGTYLKLEAGEEGLLDVVVQFKYYAKDIVYGVANVVLATYKIFNLSDSKPKFLVYKQQTVQPNQYEHIDIDGEVTLSAQTKTFAQSELESVDNDYYVHADVVAKLDRVSLQDTNSFTVYYDSASLQFDSATTSGCIVNSMQAGRLDVSTTEPDVNVFQFKFLVKGAQKKFDDGQTWSAQLKIDDVQYYYANYDRVDNIKAVDGELTFIANTAEQQ